MSFRFTAPDLLNLGPPPGLAAEEFEVLLERARTRLVGELQAGGVVFEVARLDANPVMRVTRTDVMRDFLRRQEIDETARQSYLGSASGAFLDARAADYGVVRRVIQVADPAAGVPELREDDASLRLRTQLAWEALSVAGPSGAYVFHALDAHPGVFDAVAYGPESGHVAAGEVLVVVQGRNGVTTAGMVDAVAARLDAHEVIYGRVETLTIAAPGAGYQAGDVLSAVDGDGSGFAGHVLAVDEDGAIVAVMINTAGTGFVDRPPVSVNSAGGSGAQILADIAQYRLVRNEQSVRPVAARVIVAAAQPKIYTATATLYVGASGDREAIRLAALANLQRYQESRRRIGRRVPKSGLEAALALVSPEGIPVIPDVDVVEPDLVPSHMQIPVPGAVTLTVEVR